MSSSNSSFVPLLNEPAPSIPTASNNHAPRNREARNVSSWPIEQPPSYTTQTTSSYHTTPEALPESRPYEPEMEHIAAKSNSKTHHAPIRGWLLEIAGVITSITCLIGLIILVSSQDGQPLSMWTFYFPLNTAVAILTVVIKTPLAFVVGECLAQGKWVWFSKRKGPLSVFVRIEEAGRGPLGSLFLLWDLKLRHWASFGALITIALITIALLTVDPFLQTIISYEGQSTPINTGAASLPRASRLDVGDWMSEPGLGIKYHENSAVVDYYYMYPDISLAVSTQMGFLNESTLKPSSPPGVTCSTGNCTWPAFSSVGICSTCVDITQHLHRKTGVGMNLACAASAVQQSPYVKYELPYGQNLAPVYFHGSTGYANISSPGDSCNTKGIRQAIGLSVRPNETYSFQEWDTLLASFAVLQAPDEFWANQIPWENASIKATECALRYCVQVYQTTMINGKANESTTQVSFKRLPESYQPLLKNFPLLDEIKADFGNSLARLNETGVSDNSGVIPRSDLQLQIANKGIPGDVQMTFNITQKSIATMISSMPGMVGDINRALSTSNNITAQFETVARLLSYRMREIDATNVPGTSEQWIIYIRVRWVYLAVPLAISLAGFVFAVGVIVDSRCIQLEPLKSDPLNLLLHGLDEGARDASRARMGRGDKADQVTVGLREGSYGLELKL